MIKYKLKCKNCEKNFDSWFSSSLEFEKLKNKKFLNCHFCGSKKIDKNLMAPNILNSVSSVEKKAINKKRQNILRRYLDGIKKLKNIKPTYPYNLPGSSYWLFSIKTKNRDDLIDYLKSKNISTAVHFVPLPLNSI